VADLPITRPPNLCYHAKFGRSALNDVRINIGKPQTLRERWNSALFGWEAWLNPRYTLLPDMCYQVKFGSSATKGVRINRKEPQKLGSAWAQPPCGRGVGGPLKYTSRDMGYPAEFGRSTNGMSVIKEIRLIILTLVSRLPRSLKVVRTNT